MARSYHVGIAAVVADADAKWVDNLLSHSAVPGVESAQRGIPRRLSLDAIRTIVLVRSLSGDAGMSLDRALAAASALLASADPAVPLGRFVSATLDRAHFDDYVDRRLAAAVESTVPRRRGRPPTRTATK